MLLFSFFFANQKIKAQVITNPLEPVNQCQTIKIQWTHLTGCRKYVISVYLDGAIGTAPALHQKVFTQTNQNYTGVPSLSANFTTASNWHGTLVYDLEYYDVEWFVYHKLGDYITTTPIVEHTVTPPLPQVITGCGGTGHMRITIPNKSGFTVNWYASATAPFPFHQGNYYDQYFTGTSAGLQTYFVSYVETSGSCTFESLRVPVAFIRLPDVPTQKLGDQFVEDYQTLGNCNLPSAYYDLQGSADLSKIQAVYDALPQAVKDVLKVNLASTRGHWEDHNFFTVIPVAGGTEIDRVCYTHLPAGQCTYRDYYYYMDYSVTTSLEDPITHSLVSPPVTLTCSDRILQQRVYKAIFDPVTETNLCNYVAPIIQAIGARGTNDEMQDEQSSQSLSLESNNPDHIVTLYPNPASDKFTIEYASMQSNDLHIVMTDVLGNQVKSLYIRNAQNHLTVPVEDIPSGTYLVSILNEQSAPISKIIIIYK